MTQRSCGKCNAFWLRTKLIHVGYQLGMQQVGNHNSMGTAWSKPNFMQDQAVIKKCVLEVSVNLSISWCLKASLVAPAFWHWTGQKTTVAPWRGGKSYVSASPGFHGTVVAELQTDSSLHWSVESATRTSTSQTVAMVPMLRWVPFDLRHQWFWVEIY